MTTAKPLSKMSKAELTQEQERLKMLRADEIRADMGNSDDGFLRWVENERYGRSDVYWDQSNRSNGLMAMFAMAFAFLSVPVVIVAAIFLGR